MYLISVYFDEKTNKTLERYIFQIANKTGNTFMKDNNVPPHLTISSFEMRDIEIFIPRFEILSRNIKSDEIDIVSIGMLFPYVLYTTPVLNKYLYELTQSVYDCVMNVPEVNVNKFYKPMQWLPHITLGKTLTKEQMRIAFELVQNNFQPLRGKITKIGLAKTNPHEDLKKVLLR